MDTGTIKKEIQAYQMELASDNGKIAMSLAERFERSRFYKSWTKDRLQQIAEEEIRQYFIKLSALRVWNNKNRAIDKILGDNGLEVIRVALAELIWGVDPVELRWDNFRGKLKGMGPGISSELLMNAHPDECMIYNRFIADGLSRLGVKDMPSTNKFTGGQYRSFCMLAMTIAEEIRAATGKDANLLTVDHFLCTLAVS